MSITLSSVSLPDPSSESIEVEIFGSSYFMASGAIQHDNISTTPIHTFTLTWRAVTEAQRDSIVSAYTALYTMSIPTYTDIRVDNFNVIGLPNRPKAKVTTINANPLRYDVTISFIQRI